MHNYDTILMPAEQGIQKRTLLYGMYRSIGEYAAVTGDYAALIGDYAALICDYAALIGDYAALIALIGDYADIRRLC